jgi:hypothetical protein
MYLNLTRDQPLDPGRNGPAVLGGDRFRPRFQRRIDPNRDYSCFRDTLYPARCDIETRCRDSSLKDKIINR